MVALPPACGSRCHLWLYCPVHQHHCSLQLHQRLLLVLPLYFACFIHFALQNLSFCMFLKSDCVNSFFRLSLQAMFRGATVRARAGSSRRYINDGSAPAEEEVGEARARPWRRLCLGSPSSGTCSCRIRTSVQRVAEPVRVARILRGFVASASPFHLYVLSLFYNVRLSSIAYIHIDINESRHIYVSRFINF